MVRFHSTRIGDFEASEKEIFFLPEGLLGFPHERKFCLLELERQPAVKLFQSLGDPALGFCIVRPEEFFSDYHPPLPPKELDLLCAASEEEIERWAILTFHRDPFRVTANLQGPLLLNRTRGMGRQIVLKNMPYHTRHLLVEE